MDDVLFMEMADAAVRYVDEKYGRAAAWMTAVAMIALPVALIGGAVWWFLS
ncbi:MAG: hypothetical protein V4472_26465 [Pseudomonadota bacterium]